MRPTVITCGPYAAPSATNIRTASSVAAAGNVTLNGSLVSSGVATLDQPRRVLFTSAGNDSGITFTVYGNDWNANPVSDVVTGANASTAYTKYDFKTVTRIVASGASAGNVSIGTNALASSRPVFLDSFADSSISIITDTAGSTGISYTIRYSGDNPNATQLGIGTDTYATTRWINSANSALVAATSAVIAEQSGIPQLAQVLINNAGSDTSASVHVTFTQAGVAPY